MANASSADSMRSGFGWLYAVPSAGVRKMNDSIVALDLLLECGTDQGEEVTRTDPVSVSINCASVTQDNRWVVRIGTAFEFALNVKDCTLRSLPGLQRAIAWESPTERCLPIREVPSRVYKSLGVLTPELLSSRHRARL
jgi:hypothetical protein